MTTESRKSDKVVTYMRCPIPEKQVEWERVLMRDRLEFGCDWLEKFCESAFCVNIVGDSIEAMADRITKLEAALLVYDATLHIVASLYPKPIPDFIRSQIESAREAYLWATGEESMVHPRSLSQTESSHDN